MRLLINDRLALTPAEFAALPNYSMSLPTGQTPGKAWRALRGDEWWRGVYGKPYPPGHQHHGSIPIGWRAIRVIGTPAGWPVDIAIPLRELPRR